MFCGAARRLRASAVCVRGARPAEERRDSSPLDCSADLIRHQVYCKCVTVIHSCILYGCVGVGALMLMCVV